MLSKKKKKNDAFHLCCTVWFTKRLLEFILSDVFRHVFPHLVAERRVCVPGKALKMKPTQPWSSNGSPPGRTRRQVNK